MAASPSAPPEFKPGTLVEISSDDPGFRGSWYTGKVVRKSSSKTPTKLLIDYTHLFADESGSKPLRETLDVYQLRPEAPREKHRVFKYGEEVDAFLSDGWWEGSITKDFGDGNFKVFFKASREHSVFSAQDLRLHREWFHGQWDPPLEEEQPPENEVDNLHSIDGIFLLLCRFYTLGIFFNMHALISFSILQKVPVTTEEKSGVTKTGEIFSQGALVEVSSDEDGFHGAWFTATIVEAVGKDKFLIEYQNLRTEDDTELLKEEADTLHIRPHPPEEIMVDRFSLLQEVDALYNDGWWVGVIAKVLSNSRYVVYFKDTDEEMTFEHSDLRLHREWTGSKWLMAS
ncbi:LOW QUALITY PROTEIN: Agenet domain-containing protein, partial [Cephalotus follicularis]